MSIRLSSTLLFTLLFTVSSALPQSSLPESQEANRKAVVRFFEEVQNLDKVELVDSLFAENAVFNGQPFDRQRFKDRRKTPSTAFADFIIKIDEIHSFDDYVLARTSATARSTGEWLGFPSSNGPIHMWAMDLFRFENGRIVEQRHIADRLGTLIEMGHIPLKKNQQ